MHVKAGPCFMCKHMQQSAVAKMMQLCPKGAGALEFVHHLNFEKVWMALLQLPPGLVKKVGVLKFEAWNSHEQCKKYENHG